MPEFNKHQRVFTLEQAVETEPSLALLQERIRVSRENLDIVLQLIPANLHPHIQAGPINAGEWCLLVHNAAVSTKLRQLLPAMQSLLSKQGRQVTSVRLKIQTRQP